MNKHSEMIEIVNSHINGNGRQMVNQIDEYGTYDFFADLVVYLGARTESASSQYYDFQKITVKYHRIKAR